MGGEDQCRRERLLPIGPGRSFSLAIGAPEAMPASPRKDRIAPRNLDPTFFGLRLRMQGSVMFPGQAYRLVKVGPTRENTELAL